MFKLITKYFVFH